MTKILYGPNLLSSLKNKTIFIDTNIFILASRRADFIEDVLAPLANQGSALITIPAVVIELCRGSKDTQEYNKRKSLITSVSSIYQIDKHLENQSEQKDIATFTLLASHLCSGMDYTDFLLGYCLYKFPETYLLTENHKHFPVDVFDREQIISFDISHEIHNPSIYKINKEKLNKAAANIING